jgi:hypothetical protein
MTPSKLLEGIFLRLTPIGAAGITLSASCLLCLSAWLLGLGSNVRDHTIAEPLGKEVGLLYAPNWILVYMVLFPAYMATFAYIIEAKHKLLTESAKRRDTRIICSPAGEPIELISLRNAWKRKSTSLDILLIVLALSVLYSSILQWVKGCYLPFSRSPAVRSNLDLNALNSILRGEVIDWSTISYVTQHGPAPIVSLIYSSIAFSYMAIALWIYLAILAYCAHLAWVITKIADGSLFMNMAHRGTEPTGWFRSFFIYCFILTFLGISAGYFMRLQALYLNSDANVIFDYSFWDLKCLLIRDCTLHSGTRETASVLMGILEAIYTCFMFVIAVAMLSSGFDRVNRYFLNQIGDPTWRSNFGMAFNFSQVRIIRRARFFGLVIERPFAALISIILLLAVLAVPYVSLLYFFSVIAAIYVVVGYRVQKLHFVPPVEPPDAPLLQPVVLPDGEKSRIARFLDRHRRGSLVPDAFLAGVVKRSNIPEEYKEHIINSVRRNQGGEDSLVFVDACLRQGNNPPETDERELPDTILAAVLLALREHVGLDSQCAIVGFLTIHKLLKNTTRLNVLLNETCVRLQQTSDG